MGVLLLAGCTSTPGSPDPEPTAAPSAPTLRTEVAAPCGDTPAQTIQLGSPYRGQAPATFEVTGTGVVWVTARLFPSGGPFDPETGITGIYIGPADVTPTYDEQTSRVDGATLSTRAVEGTYSELPVQPGTYWLWSSAGGDVVLLACTDGLIGATQAATPAPPSQRE